MSRVKQWSKVPLILTAAEAAEVVGVTPYTMGQYLISGRIPGRKVGRSWRVSRDELRNFIEGGNSYT